MGASAILKPKLVRLGNIKIGGLGPVRQARSGNDYRLPQKHPFFTITGIDRDGDDNLEPNHELMNELIAAGFGSRVPDWEAKACGLRYIPGPEPKLQDGEVAPQGKAGVVVYGDKEYLRRIPCVAYSNDPDEVIRCSWMWYNGERLAASSDGIKLRVWYDRHANEWYNEARVMEWRPQYADSRDPAGNKLFKLHTILNVAVRSRMATLGGVYQFRTTSSISSEQIMGSLSCLTDQIRGMPLQLVLKPINVRPGGKDTTVYVVHLEMDGREFEAMREAIERNRQALMQKEQEFKAMLEAHPSDAFDDPKEEAGVGREFHPDQQKNEPVL